MILKIKMLDWNFVKIYFGGIIPQIKTLIVKQYFKRLIEMYTIQIKKKYEIMDNF